MNTIEKAKGKVLDFVRAVGRFSKEQALRFEKYFFNPRNFWALLVLCFVLASLNYLFIVWAAGAVTNAPCVLPTLVGTVTGTPARSPTSVSEPTCEPVNTPTTAGTSSSEPTLTATPPWELAMDLYFASLPYPLRKPASEWTISPDGLQFSTFWEGYRAYPYDDGGQQGVGNCTVGYGHLLHLGTCNGSEGGSISQAAALKLLENELNHCGSYIDKYVDAPITQNQFNTMSSLICNWGEGKFGQSEVVALINEGRYMDAGERWKTTATCGIGIGCGIRGLIRRRAMESHFFTSPVGTPMWPFVELE